MALPQFVNLNFKLSKLGKHLRQLFKIQTPFVVIVTEYKISLSV